MRRQDEPTEGVEVSNGGWGKQQIPGNGGDSVSLSSDLPLVE